MLNLRASHLLYVQLPSSTGPSRYRSEYAVSERGIPMDTIGSESDCFTAPGPAVTYECPASLIDRNFEIRLFGKEILGCS